MPYQDTIALLVKAIDYHNRQAMTDFSNAEFHKKQAMVLKMYLIDLKEFIMKHESQSL
jgi:hypothetical protein